jgi:acetyl esterase/lipase
MQNIFRSLLMLASLIGCPWHLSASVIAPEEKPDSLEGVEALTRYGIIDADIVYGQADGFPLKLDLYRPRAEQGIRHPVVLYIHGGAWARGSKASYVPLLFPWLGRGWTVVSIDYRLTPIATAPAALEDTRCALRWVFDNADRYGFDVRHVAVVGQSSGAHLALMTSLASSDPAFDRNCPGRPVRPAAAVSIVGFADLKPVTDSPTPFKPAVDWLAATRTSTDDIVQRMSPINHVYADSVPIISVHGDSDTTHPYASVVAFHQKLKSAGVHNELVTLPGLNGTQLSQSQNDQAYSRIFAFLQELGF